MKRVLVVFGADREAVKIAPVVAALRGRPECVVGTCVASRSEATLKPILDAFDIVADFGPDPALPEPATARPSSAGLAFLGGVYREFTPGLVLVSGACAAAVAAALAAHGRRIPVGHVDAGLRTAEVHAPWSAAEMNGRVVEALASWLFVSTAGARDALLDEGVAPERVVLTGPTAMDALAPVVAHLQRDLSLRLKMSIAFPFLDARRPLVLVSVEPREGAQDRLQDFCRALRTTARMHPEVQMVFPVATDQRFQAEVEAVLRDVPGIHRIGPVDYVSLVHLMTRSHFIVSDTDAREGEASALGKRLVVASGAAAPAGSAVSETVMPAPSDPDLLAAAMHRLLEEPLKRRHAAPPPASAQDSDEAASRRIAQVLLGPERNNADPAWRVPRRLPAGGE